MLKLPQDCRGFRAARMAGRPESGDHLDQCARCAAWAQRALPPSAAGDHDRPKVPAALAARLRAIPVEEVVCRDLARHMAAARSRARGDVPAPQVVAHWQHCARCRQTYEALSVAMVAGQRQLPLPARGRLRGLRKRPSVVPFPGRIGRDFDLRWAAAASLLIGLLLQPLSADMAGMTRAAQAHTETNVAALMAAGRSQQDVWQRELEAVSERGALKVRQRLRSYSATWRTLYQRSHRLYSDHAVAFTDSFAARRGDDHE